MKESLQCVPCCNRSRIHEGRTRHKKGYVMVRALDHPRGPYVFEHILVLEAHLGRLLYADETVHHRNGVKDDNALGNLELWVKPQPSGIRATDAVKWASEILRRYEDLAL